MSAKITKLLFLLILPLYAINVSVTILPQKGVIKAIAKEKAHVNVMVPPGSSPATYAPNFAQLKAVKNSKIYFTIGVPFDKKYLNKIKEINPSIEVVDFGKWIKKENNNPHIWLSPAMLMLEAKVVLNTFIKHDPDNKEFYINNYISYIEKLKNLEKEGFGIKQKAFITFHPSFYYFAKDFLIREIAIQKEGKAPSFAYLAKIIKLAKKYKVKTVIISPEFPTKYAKIVAGKIGAKVVVISPLNENPTTTVKELIKALK
jgi:zinc transport system substrate-binding protein